MCCGAIFSLVSPVFCPLGVTNIESSHYLLYVVLTYSNSDQTLYSQIHNGSRIKGGQRKRYKDHTKATLKRCDINPGSLERKASNRTEWKSACKTGLIKMEDDLSNQRAERRNRRHERRADIEPPTAHVCQTCNRTFTARIGLFSHMRWHQRNNQ